MEPQTKTQHIPVTKFWINSSPYRYRIVEVPIMGSNNENTLYTENFYRRLFLAPKKKGLIAL